MHFLRPLPVIETDPCIHMNGKNRGITASGQTAISFKQIDVGHDYRKGDSLVEMKTIKNIGQHL